MPFNRKLYPETWDAIRARITRRAGSRCEFLCKDGTRCNVPNGIIWRSREDKERWWPVLEGEPDPQDAYLVQVVLTTAHLDHDPSHNDDDNLRLGCQLHHLRHDVGHHRASRAASRRSRKQNLELPL